MAGVATRQVIKPIAKSSVKGTIKIGLILQQLSREAAAEFHDIAAEASADMPKSPAKPTVVSATA